MNRSRVSGLLVGIPLLCVLVLSERAAAQTALATDQSPLTGQAATHSSTSLNATPVNDTALIRAKLWGLSPEDWQRYQTLMQGIRGSISPETLSPIEVLGIHARTAEERERYAEQWARLMREDASRILAFQHAYDAAQQRLFPDEALIDAVKLADYRSLRQIDLATAEMKLSAMDRLLFFTATDCATCDAVLDRLLGQLASINGIDVYLLDIPTGDEQRIRQWAGSRNIDPDWVHERRVTLNVDAGALATLAASLGEQWDQRPVVLRRRGETIVPLSSARF